MFREMHRAKQAISREECIRLLKTETRGVLSVIGDDGYPYGSPINHFYNEEDAEEFRLYADKTLVFSMSIEHMTGKTTHEA